ncbi:MAG: hypothetical protein OEY28_01055, partial [Nitrospira sp.]|nr:hypothetical protein [Nitrospira sp.]
IDVASVRWADGRTMGLEFIQIDPAAHLRLQYFVWDLMLERIFSRIRENSSVPVQANSEVEHHPAV